MKRLVLCSISVVLGTVAVLQSQAPFELHIDVTANRRAIDPRIYGVAYADDAALADLRIPLHRSGGNAQSRYNWQANASNRAADWYFESIPDGPAVPGDAADIFVSRTKARGAETILTVPTLSWVARVGSSRNNLASFSIAKYGPQTGADTQWFPDAGNGVSATTGQPISGNDPADASVSSTPTFQRSWVQHLVSKWGTAAHGGVRYYALDNEPSLWHITHRDVHPAGATMDEVYNATVAYGSQIKAVDPSALILAPEEWGWSGYLYSGADQQWGGLHGWTNLPDRAAHGGSDYLPWYLDRMRVRDTAAGQRLLDVFTVHYYPQAGQYGDDTSPAMQRLRNRSTRALWDPSYVDESWIGTQVQLIPRLKNWVATSYPNTKIGITEYNWGAAGHINGATTQADILGIFGREGLDLATLWGTPASSSPTYKAIKMYRNYDGQGSAFGDISVSATAQSPDLVSAFAAERRTDGALTIMTINKDLSTAPVNFRLGSFAASGPAQVWQLTASNAITRLPDTAVASSTFSATLPAQSITLFVLGTAAQAQPQAPTNLRIVSGAPTGSPSSLTASGGTPQGATVNTVFSTSLKAMVRDSASNPLSGITVTFTAPSTGASAHFNGSTSATAVSDATGVATVPTLAANGQAGSYTITARVTGVAAPATFSLTNSASSGGSGWTRQAVPVSTNTCGHTGVGSVMGDPVRPSDFYAMVCQDNGPMAVLKSTDYGQTWTNVNRTAALSGRPWGATIDPNPNRNPNTPPTIYTPAGYGALGLFKSTDGGVNWTQMFNGPTVFDPYSPFNLPPDIYGISVLPNNYPNHIVVTFHGSWRNSGDAGFGESTDGGVTWTVHNSPAGIGQSHYMIVLDSSTWLSVAQDSSGVWKTSTAGRVGGVPSVAAWRKVDNMEHFHGAFQPVVDTANNSVYIPGYHGIRRSADRGETWTWAYQTTGWVSHTIATGNYIYANFTLGPNLMRASRSTGTGFTTYTTTPPGMVEGTGPYGAAASFNGTNWVIVAGHQTYGIWRWVE